MRIGSQQDCNFVKHNEKNVEMILLRRIKFRFAYVVTQVIKKHTMTTLLTIDL
ncbi:hypothetical protein SDC9_123284 [bioreactor metagenome]|uniref:Uncharacterized protein n=1 Tax=bioreactor metagenome TaxID=1076179 RepID=A0A645CH60_9ZZZZ